ncbi:MULTISPECIES: hypothetical protein [Clostridium]|uniref:hypothetical protein n=1 Tax=Clostridium TaxID=1485 RepID=UPI00082667A5|nr:MULTISPECIES: hypothetical protein [Clostridium]PJI10248.1 hypothetical protein CUB90_21260 [Clostridium sp. CT7]
MFILVFGNGNSGAEAANIIFKITSSKNNIVKYYYEYPPHNGWHFTKELETTKYIDSKSSRTELIKLMEKADLLFSCGWVHKISANITNEKNVIICILLFFLYIVEKIP